MKIYDLGGGPTFRGIWGRYYSEVHAAVFVVDSCDERKMQAAKDALHGVFFFIFVIMISFFLFIIYFFYRGYFFEDRQQ